MRRRVVRIPVLVVFGGGLSQTGFAVIRRMMVMLLPAPMSPGVHQICSECSGALAVWQLAGTPDVGFGITSTYRCPMCRVRAGFAAEHPYGNI